MGVSSVASNLPGSGDCVTGLSGGTRTPVGIRWPGRATLPRVLLGSVHPPDARFSRLWCTRADAPGTHGIGVTWSGSGWADRRRRVVPSRAVEVVPAFEGTLVSGCSETEAGGGSIARSNHGLPSAAMPSRMRSVWENPAASRLISRVPSLGASSGASCVGGVGHGDPLGRTIVQARQSEFVVSSLVMAVPSACLVAATPRGSSQSMLEGAGRIQDQRQETSDLGDCEATRPAWTFGSMAAVTARKACAVMAMVMCRYHGSHLRTW